MLTKWHLPTIAAAFYSSALVSAHADDRTDAQAILETNNCPAHISTVRDRAQPQDFFLPSLRYIGCALQTLSAAEHMNDDVLRQSGDRELYQSVIYLQNNINNFVTDQTDKLRLSGELDQATRAYIYDHAIRFREYDVFIQTAPIGEIGDDVSTLFYLREHLAALDETQYREAANRARREMPPPATPFIMIEFKPVLCDVQTPLADPYAPCRHI